MDMAARRASRKAAWHLIPFLLLCYVIAFLDRVNVGFAALTMNKELGLTAEMFGFAAGIFFFGYFIFEVPSNLILERDRRAAMDCQDHDLLGRDFRIIRFCAFDFRNISKLWFLVFR